MKFMFVHNEGFHTPLTGQMSQDTTTISGLMAGGEWGDVIILDDSDFCITQRRRYESQSHAGYILELKHLFENTQAEFQMKKKSVNADSPKPQVIKDPELFRDILENVAKLVTEVQYEVRKGVPQSFYVVEISEGEFWDGDNNEFANVPEWSIGFWRTRDATDLRYTPVEECYTNKSETWVPAKRVITTTWE